MSSRLFPAGAALAGILAVSCGFDPVDTGDPPSDYAAEFELFWHTVDLEYVSLSRAGVDWDALYQQYAPAADTVSSQSSLMLLLNDMMLHFEDPSMSVGSFDPDVTPPQPWDPGVQPNFDMDVLWTYLEPAGFEWFQQDIWGWCMLGEVLYVMVPEWYGSMSGDPLEALLLDNPDIPAVILDVRMNTGSGPDYRLGELARIFNGEVRIGFYSVARNGPEPEDLCDPVPRYVPRNTMFYDGPVYVLLGEACGGTSEEFACMVSELPGVTTLGDTTMRCSSDEFIYDLPAGWFFAVPESTIVRADGATWVQYAGVPPDIHVEATEEDFAAGIDPVLEYALEAAQQ